MAEAEILQLYELHYSDLKLLSSGSGTPSSSTQLQRLETIKTSIMEALGPRGPGLLSVVGVPNASTLRRHLLPLARKLALLNPDDRKRIFKEKAWAKSLLLGISVLEPDALTQGCYLAVAFFLWLGFAFS